MPLVRIDLNRAGPQSSKFDMHQVTGETSLFQAAARQSGTVQI